MHPLISILIKPKKTFEKLNETNESKKYQITNWLFFFGAMPAAFNTTYDLSLIFGINIFITLAIALILIGAVGLFLMSTVGSYIFWGTSKILQGKASKEDIQLSLALAQVPNLIILFIKITMLIPAIAMNDYTLLKYQHPIILIPLSILSFSILTIGIAYFNKFSYIHAILTTIIPPAFTFGVVYIVKHIIQ